MFCEKNQKKEKKTNEKPFIADPQQSPTNLPYSFIMPERSPSSTTLEDVLSSLLGLTDSNSHRPSTGMHL